MTDGVVVNTMTYDGYGNIQKKNGKVYTYGDDDWKDKLTAYDGQAITYDAQGNPVSYLGHTLTWEKGRQLKSFDSNTYTYNANGIRTSKTVNGVKHTYTLDGTKIITETWQELGEDNTEQTRVLTPLYDNEESVCGIMYDGALYYFLKNLQGDIIAITNQNGVTLARYAYDAWGACTITEDNSNCSIATINPFRYRGYYYDAEIGMYYLQSRYYCVTIGRFINGDSTVYLGYSGCVGAYNIFTYCENDCINFVDFYGHLPGDVKMHNAVLYSAQLFLFSVGCITNSEVKTCNRWGFYNGRMDLYSYISNRVWEVKPNSSSGRSAGRTQLKTYTSSFVYSLYHSRAHTKKTPVEGRTYVYGAVVVSNRLVLYWSLKDRPALIVYEDRSMKQVAQLLFNIMTATAAARYAKLANLSARARKKAEQALEFLKVALGAVGRFTNDLIKAVTNLLKTLAPAIMLLIVILILACLGIPVII